MTFLMGGGDLEGGSGSGKSALPEKTPGYACVRWNLAIKLISFLSS